MRFPLLVTAICVGLLAHECKGAEDNSTKIVILGEDDADEETQIIVTGSGSGSGGGGGGAGTDADGAGGGGGGGGGGEVHWELVERRKKIDQEEKEREEREKYVRIKEVNKRKYGKRRESIKSYTRRKLRRPKKKYALSIEDDKK